MTEHSSAPSPWAQAADRLAALATRRARVDSFARPASIALAATGALLLIGKAARILDPTAGWLVSALGVVVTLFVGVRAAQRVTPTTRATAAWALDRLAGAHERGLTVAMAGEDAARTVDGSRVPPPPPTRLRPADGTVLVLVAALVTLAGALWQGPASQVPAVRVPASASAVRGGATGSAPASEAARKDADARASETQATSERGIREALGLPQGAPLDEAQVAERLADRTARAAALAASPTGSAAAAALRHNDPGAAAALVRALESGAGVETERLRKEAASLRLDSDAVPIPPTRRAVVARYLSSLASASSSADPAPK